MRRWHQPPPHPTDPPTTTNRHTNALPPFPGNRAAHTGKKGGAEAGTANSALTQGGRCTNVGQPLTNPGPDLHPSDELPVLCQNVSAPTNRPSATPVNPPNPEEITVLFRAGGRPAPRRCRRCIESAQIL
jgi:hypothetical protein